MRSAIRIGSSSYDLDSSHCLPGLNDELIWYRGALLPHFRFCPVVEFDGHRLLDMLVAYLLNCFIVLTVNQAAKLDVSCSREM